MKREARGGENGDGERRGKERMEIGGTERGERKDEEGEGGWREDKRALMCSFHSLWGVITHNSPLSGR